jgi:replicative DNA helicase
MHKEFGIKLIAIDYLQIMSPSQNTAKDNRQQQVAEMSGGIKQLAKELNIPIIVLAQLNRDVDKNNAMPRLSNLRESGSIEQDADIVAFLHRDRDETKVNTNMSKEELRNGVDAKLIIEKNRNGKTGIIDLRFRPDIMLFESKSRYDEKDYPPRRPSNQTDAKS